MTNVPPSRPGTWASKAPWPAPAHHVRVLLRVRDTDVRQFDIEILRRRNSISNPRDRCGSSSTLPLPSPRTDCEPLSHLVHGVQGSTDAVGGKEGRTKLLYTEIRMEGTLELQEYGGGAGPWWHRLALCSKSSCLHPLRVRIR